MTTVKTPLAMAGGLLTTLCVAVFAQNGPDQPGPASSRSGSPWSCPRRPPSTGSSISKSPRSARCHREDRAEAGRPGPQGSRHRLPASRSLAAGRSESQDPGRRDRPMEKGEAAFFVAVQTVARNQRLNEKKPGLVSAEDVAKAEGELKVAKAQTKEAVEQQAVAKAEFAIADQASRSTRSSRPSTASSSRCSSARRERPGQ